MYGAHAPTRPANSIARALLLAKNDGSSLDIYRRGYENALVDVHELFHDHVSDEQMLMTVANFFKVKEADLQALISKNADARTLA